MITKIVQFEKYLEIEILKVRNSYLVEINKAYSLFQVYKPA